MSAQFTVTTPEIATGTSLKTLLQLIAGSNKGIKVHAFGISFKGVSPTDPPILVEILRQTTAGTAGSSVTPRITDGSTDTLEATTGTNMSAEPTASDILWSRLVHPQGGVEYQLPFGKEWVVAKTARLGLRVTAGVSVNAVVTMHGTE